MPDSGRVDDKGEGGEGDAATFDGQKAKIKRVTVERRAGGLIQGGKLEDVRKEGDWSYVQ